MKTKYESDFLIIGSGIAGLSFAIKAARLGTVNIVTKKSDSDSNTNYAQGGIASVLAPGDSFRSHINDTMKAGAGIGNREAVEIMVKDGPARIGELLEWGTRFSTHREGGKKVLDLGREGGHSRKRIVHAADLTGREIETALLGTIAGIDRIRIFENHTAIDLLTEHQLKSRPRNGKIHCYGAYILDNESMTVRNFTARFTLLATGGAGQVYLHTTNPEIATGDGIVMAYNAGAAVGDMEFIQFHPTSFYDKNAKGRSFLISEAVRGEGGVLVNSRGERFMEKAHPLKDLAPRDIVARAIDRELKRLGDDCVYLDITARGRAFLKKRFPQIYGHCRSAGIDMAREPVPVVPAAHYLCGGVITDTSGRTAIENLYVSGEAACTGVHGANRLASNSLLEGIVFSHRAYLHMAGTREGGRKEPKIPPIPRWDKKGTFDLDEWILVNHNMEDVKRVMWDYVGIVRTDLRLQMAKRRIDLLAEEIENHYRKSTISPQLVELRNIAAIARLIIQCAMTRRDSVGLHFNSDHPGTDRVPRRTLLRAGEKPALISLPKGKK